MIVIVPGVIRMSGNSTANDVVFVIGANGYSTIGTASPVQEAMPSNQVFE
jgi:predicted ribosome-associated RNA-binding protein Tma20